MKKIQSIFLLTVLSCNAKGVECADSTQPCVSTQTNEDSHELSFDNTYDNDQSNDMTTINNDTTIINNPIVNISPAVGGAGGSGNIEPNVGGSGGADVDAGVVGSGDASTPHTVVMCDSPNAVGTDVRNWFATSADATDWFQLVTFDGFSEDRCTYTGKIKWFYEGSYGYWESDRVYDSPTATFTIGFTTDGFVKGDYHEPTTAYPNGYVVIQELTINNCYAGLGEGNPLTFDPTYRYYNCLTEGGGNHPFRLYVFRGTWVNDRPIMTQQVYPPNRG